MCRRFPLVLAFIFIVALSLPGMAVDRRSTDKNAGASWPQWRGPHRDGISSETGLLERWPEGGPPLVWKASGLGTGYSSVSIADGRIFTLGDMDGGEHVIALNLGDGKEIWKQRVGDAFKNNNADGPRSTPTVDGALLYALTPHGDLVCLQTADGKEVWRKNLKKDFDGKMHSGWGYSESPLVDGDKLMCTPGGPEATVVALNKKTGEEIWRCAVPKFGDKGKDGAGYSSIVIGNGAGVRQYVQLIGRGVIGISTDGGKYLWGYNHVSTGVAGIPTPIVHDDYVFCSCGYNDGGTALVKLKASTGGGLEAEEQWYFPSSEMQNHHGGMIMLGDYVYFGHGQNKGFPTCVEWKTGKTTWDKRRGAGEGSAATVFADGNLYFRYQDGTMVLIAANPKEYEEKGSFKIPGQEKPSWPHPAIARGKLYLREQDSLLCYDIKR